MYDHHHKVGQCARVRCCTERVCSGIAAAAPSLAWVERRDELTPFPVFDRVGNAHLMYSLYQVRQVTIAFVVLCDYVIMTSTCVAVVVVRSNTLAS
jgi:hypothetical protein